ncbi:MAG: DUF5615 family PIN-like protein [Dehalococcoidia bacterium]|nr:DUF5615 family PIN-like protein [Dehalococcoidia bacterium]
MGLRFFADHCVANYIVETLRSGGYEVHRLRDHIPTDSPDTAVISRAQELDCILISLNGDFADIVSYPPGDYIGIIALQVRNHPEIVPQLIARFKEYLGAHPTMDHYRGKLLLVESHRIRVRQSAGS